MSVCEGDSTMVANMLRDTPDLVNTTDGWGLTPLRWAAFYGHKEIVELLLDKGAKINHSSSLACGP